MIPTNSVFIELTVVDGGIVDVLVEVVVGFDI
jgi:hypothetical protein